MAHKNSRLPFNVPGKYYVDDNCIDCDLCRETSDSFERNSEHGLSYVLKQPVTSEELARAEEALEFCPVNAIGNDGE
jgi:ferredoxin